MSYVFDGLEPKAVLKNFYDFSQAAPRMNMESGVGAYGGSNFLVEFAKKLGLDYYQDENLNVIIYKPATPGYEHVPTVMLEGHIDMVCAADDGVEHDWEHDPVEIVVDDDKDTVHANGTTLGADDGLGIAMIMAVLESKEIEHPALECVFTINEETDMYGALHLHYEKLKSKIVISMDATRISLGGGGQYDLELLPSYEKIPAREGDIQGEIRISGLLGGHSGKNAYMERGNANVLVCRVLSELEKKNVPFRLISFIGGEFTSCAIARNAVCRLAFPEACRDTVAATVEEYAKTFKTELEVPDPYVELEYKQLAAGEMVSETMDDASTAKFVNLMITLPDGLNSLHKYFDHKYDSTVNVGVVEMPEDKNCLRLTACIRYESASKLVLARDKVCRVCDLCGVPYRNFEDLAQWEYNPRSRAYELAKEIYSDIPGAIGQGCCEMGIFIKNMPGVDAIGLGPVVDSPHSPKEKFQIGILAEDWERFVKTLKALKDY